MRSAVIILLFLFSMLFLGAQAAQLDPPQTAGNVAPSPGQQVDSGLVHRTSY